MKDLCYAIVLLLVTIALRVVNILVAGYVIAVLWSWYLVPLGALKISVLAASGLNVLFAALCSGFRGYKPMKEDPTFTKMWLNFFSDLGYRGSILLLGWGVYMGATWISLFLT